MHMRREASQISLHRTYLPRAVAPFSSPGPFGGVRGGQERQFTLQPIPGPSRWRVLRRTPSSTRGVPFASATSECQPYESATNGAAGPDDNYYSAQIPYENHDARVRIVDQRHGSGSDR